jgi:hypothetical protein
MVCVQVGSTFRECDLTTCVALEPGRKYVDCGNGAAAGGNL